MNSLEELNNFGSTPLDYVDNRPSTVIFDRKPPLTAVDQEITITSTNVVPQPGINIKEIINYQTANVRYRVKIIRGNTIPLVGSSISWSSLPSHVSLTENNFEYTLSGIRSVSDWNFVKFYNWSLPADYASYPTWYLDCSIIYYDTVLNQDITMSWTIYDDRFYFVAQLLSSSTINATIGVNSPATVNLSASSLIRADMFNRVAFQSQLNSVATISCNGNVNVTFLTARSSINAIIGVRSPTGSNLTATANMSSILIASAVNLDPRTYIANSSTNIFATNTPQIDGPNDTDIFNITLTTSIGQLVQGANSLPSSSSITISGTKSSVNAQLATTNPVYFYPTKDSSQNGSIVWQQRRNNVLEFSYSITLTGTANNFNEQLYIFNTPGTFSWNPTTAQVVYGKIDYLVVGGGGGGSRRSAGGGGGLRDNSNVTLDNISYQIVVGNGGNAGATGQNGSNGGTSSAIGVTATGGQGGSINLTTSGSGNSGIPIKLNTTTIETSYAAGGSLINTQQTIWYSGGGGGAGSPGRNYTATPSDTYDYAGGHGALSSITGTTTYYAGGGGGSPYYSNVRPGLGGMTQVDPNWTTYPVNANSRPTQNGGGGNSTYAIGGQTFAAQNGTDGLGGGGGAGSGSTGGTAGRGGCGVVIIKVRA